MTSLPAIQGLRPIRRAIVSVTDKTGVVALCQQVLQSTSSAKANDALSEVHAVEFLSTGGTYQELKQHGFPVKEVSEFTKFPEILGGRVKTLHPKIHAGLLSIRSNATHQQSMQDLELPYIDLVIINLYQFEKYASQALRRQQDHAVGDHPNGGISPVEVIEQIDIGGPSMLRSSAKNFHDVVCISSIVQYPRLINELKSHNGCTTLEFRQQLALEAFARTSQYDSAITEYLKSISQQPANEILPPPSSPSIPPPTISTRDDSNNCCSDEFLRWQSSHQSQLIECLYPLKYGLNPHQQPACICRPPSSTSPSMPFQILNGRPGYVNLLDAINAWQLVTELSQSLPGTPPAAASFKHVSPAGVAIGKHPLTIEEANHFDLPDSIRQKLGLAHPPVHSNGTANGVIQMHPVAAAIIRARNCDPLCSFGDFVAVSGQVDETAALVLKTEVSDGIIAAGFTPDALRILSQKKSNSYVILQCDSNYSPPLLEYRELFGVGLLQRRNDADPLGHFKVLSGGKPKTALSSSVKDDIRVAAMTLKYTQSNSVCFAQNGQAIGVAAGQQSRVDAVKLAGRKTRLWQLRRHPKVLNLPFKSGLKRQERVNGRVAFVEGCCTGDTSEWDQYFVHDQHPHLLTKEEMDEWANCLSSSKGSSNNGDASSSSSLCAVSDGFFPFRDSIDVMAKNHVQWVMHPGGSVADQTIKEAAESHQIGLIESGVRLFVH